MSSHAQHNMLVVPLVEDFQEIVVCALPLAAGKNVGGHYKWHF